MLYVLLSLHIHYRSELAIGEDAFGEQTLFPHKNPVTAHSLAASASLMLDHLPKQLSPSVQHTYGKILGWKLLKLSFKWTISEFFAAPYHKIT